MFTALLSKVFPTFRYTVHEGNSYQCSECGKILLRQKTLRAHVREVHEKSLKVKNAEKDPVTCQECGKSFSETKNLNRHLQTVHGRTAHVCDTCGKFFESPAKLKNHIRVIHEGHEDHKCDQCFQTFAEARSLKTHIKCIHEGIKDHQCMTCGRCFGRKGDLTSHIKQVHEIGDHIVEYPCNYCSKIFNKKFNLKNHILTVHEGRKDHNCNYCAKPFSHKGDLNKHLRSAHKINVPVRKMSEAELWRRSQARNASTKKTRDDSNNELTEAIKSIQNLAKNQDIITSKNVPISSPLPEKMSQNENSIKQARQDYIMNMPIIESTLTPTDLGDDNQNLLGEENEFLNQEKLCENNLIKHESNNVEQHQKFEVFKVENIQEDLQKEDEMDKELIKGTIKSDNNFVKQEFINDGEEEEFDVDYSEYPGYHEDMYDPDDTNQNDGDIMNNSSEKIAKFKVYQFQSQI